MDLRVVKSNFDRIKLVIISPLFFVDDHLLWSDLKMKITTEKKNLIRTKRTQVSRIHTIVFLFDLKFVFVSVSFV